MIWVASLQFSHFRKNINQKHYQKYYQKQKYDYYQQKHLILHGGAICAANNLVRKNLSFDRSINQRKNVFHPKDGWLWLWIEKTMLYNKLPNKEGRSSTVRGSCEVLLYTVKPGSKWPEYKKINWLHFAREEKAYDNKACTVLQS